MTPQPVPPGALQHYSALELSPSGLKWLLHPLRYQSLDTGHSWEGQLSAGQVGEEGADSNLHRKDPPLKGLLGNIPPCPPYCSRLEPIKRIKKKKKRIQKKVLQGDEINKIPNMFQSYATGNKHRDELMSAQKSKQGTKATLTPKAMKYCVRKGIIQYCTPSYTSHLHTVTPWDWENGEMSNADRGKSSATLVGNQY